MHSFKHRRGEVSIIVIIFLIAIIIGLVVWYAIWGKPKAQAPASGSANATPQSNAQNINSYEGWKTYTTKYEKLSFKYPADWVLKEENIDEVDSDRILITSPKGFALKVWTNVSGIGGVCEECKNYETVETSVLGQTMGQNIIGNQLGATEIALNRSVLNGNVELGCVTFCTFPSRNAVIPGGNGEKGDIFVSGGYRTNDPQTGPYKAMSLAAFKADPNIETAKQFFQSLSY